MTMDNDLKEDLKQLLTLDLKIEALKDQIDQLNIQLQPMSTAVKIDEIFGMEEERNNYYNNLMGLQHKLEDHEEEKEMLSNRILNKLPVDSPKIIVELHDTGKIAVGRKIDPSGKYDDVLVIEREGV